jgi:eukaryotic-like serine/threonine-protein kinase
MRGSDRGGFESHEPGVVLPGPGYRVLRRLGRGGMGTVYEVEHPATGERRALKVVSAAVAAGASGDAIEARLMREAEVLSFLSGPHFARVHEVDRLDDGRPYFTMPLLEGETLRDALRRRPLAPAFACGVVSQLLDALDVVHAAGLVHRDIKPANIFLRADGQCVLLDFGLVKVPDGDPRFTPLGFSTDRSRALGTTRYLPPEVVTGRGALDRRADLFAVGVVLIEALVGRLPLSHLGRLAYFESVAQHGFPRPYDGPGAPRVPDALRPVVDRATASDPDRRYQTAREFALDLHWACLRGGFDLVGTRPLSVPAPAPTPMPRSLLGLAGAGAHFAFTLFCCVGSALGGATLLRRAEAPVVVRAESRVPAPERPAAASQPEAVVAAEPPAALPVEPSPSKAGGPDPRASERERLEAKLRAGKGTISEAREFAQICDASGDRACRERARTYIERLTGTR